jgi:hypothetical protein
MSSCGGQCQDEIPSSAGIDFGIFPPQPFTFDGSIFTIDTSGILGGGILITDPTTGLPAPGDLFLKPGSAINLMITSGGGNPPPNLTVLARGPIISGALQSFTVQIPSLPSSGNVYPTPLIIDSYGDKAIVIDGILPDTTGLIVGSTVTGGGIPSGTTATQILDNTRVVISQQPTVSAPINESLTFTLPSPIATSGTLYFSPCALAFDLASGLLYRRCAGNAPFAEGGLANANICWEDVTRFFDSSISISWEIDNETTTSASSATNYTDGSGNNTTGSSSGSSTLTVGGSGAQAFAADSTITIDPSSYTGPGTFVTPAVGKFLIYKCSSCCQNCFYVLVINTSAVTPTNIDVNGTYGDSSTSTYTPFGGSPTITTASHSQTMGGTLAILPFMNFGDLGLLCLPFSQDDSTPETLWGVVQGSFYTTSSALTNSGTQTNNGVTTPWTGPLDPGTPNFQAATPVNTCEYPGSYDFSSTLVVDTATSTAGGTTTTTVTTTTDGGTPVVVVTTSSASPGVTGSTDNKVSTNYSITVTI